MGPKRRRTPTKSKSATSAQCIVQGCQSRAGDPQHPLFTFPTIKSSKTLRKKWIENVNRKAWTALPSLLEPSKYHRVCSRHFVDSEPTRVNPVPVLNLGYPTADPVQRLLFFNPDLIPTNPLAVEENVALTNPLSVEENVAPTNPLAVEVNVAATNHLAVEVNVAATNPLSVEENVAPINPLAVEENVAPTNLEKRIAPPRKANRDMRRQALFGQFQRNTARLAVDSDDSDVSPAKKARLTPASPLLKTPPPNTAAEGHSSTSADSDSDFTSLPSMTPQKERALLNSVHDLRLENKRLRDRLDAYANKIKRAKKRLKKQALIKPSQLLASDAKVRFYTGFPSMAIYSAFYEVLRPRAERLRMWCSRGKLQNRIRRSVRRRYRRTPKKANQEKSKKTPKKRGKARQLKPKDEYLMCLMRLKMGFLEEHLADLFDVNVTYVSRSLITWIKFLANEWKCLIFVPSREAVRLGAPAAFRTPELKNTKHIIDCFEIFCESSGDLILQNLIWSNYKHHHTAKFLVSICPNGHVAFISKAYPGRVTDKQICSVSGFYRILEPLDCVMADKGFPILDELNELGCNLRIPKGRRGILQFTLDDIVQIKATAQNRIHVERAIQRLKVFRILKSEIKFTVLPQVSDMLIIIAAIVNTQPPLIREASRTNAGDLVVGVLNDGVDDFVGDIGAGDDGFAGWQQVAQEEVVV